MEMVLNTDPQKSFVMVEIPNGFSAQFDEVGLNDVVSIKGLCTGTTRGTGEHWLDIWIMGCQLVKIVEKKSKQPPMRSR